MIQYKKVGKDCFPQYDAIPMLVYVSSYYHVMKEDSGLGGLHLAETPIEPYMKADTFCEVSAFVSVVTKYN